MLPNSVKVIVNHVACDRKQTCNGKLLKREVQLHDASYLGGAIISALYQL